MGCCSGTDVVADDQRDLLALLENEVRPQPPRAVVVGLEDNNVIDLQPPAMYYVIVGRGPMAVVNHRTLLGSQEGRARLGQHPVLYVGFPNPWPRYLRHGLGQRNDLLSFPGLVNQPSVGGGTIDGGLDSQHFGHCFDREFEGLGPPEVAEEWVGLIQGRRDDMRGVVPPAIGQEIGGGVVGTAMNARFNEDWVQNAPYRLCLYDPATQTARWVYAAAIDICTGPGRPAVFAPENGDTPEIRAARTPPWLSPEMWTQYATWLGRRTLNGVDAIRNEVTWNANERVCVTAGGGVGLNAAEKARNNHCLLDWFGRAGLMPIFDNPRNITFLRRPGSDERCNPGRRQGVGINGEDDLIASSKDLRMGRGAALARARNTDNGRVQVWLSPARDRNGVVIGHRIRDWWRNGKSLNVNEDRWKYSFRYGRRAGGSAVVGSRIYDRLVIPNGQQAAALGQPRSFAGHLQFEAVERAGRMVALATADGLVRVLGAACNNYPGHAIGDRVPDTAADRMWIFHATLPVSAVPDGFIICGANVALANGYFTDHPNRNVNTMTRDEILAIVGEEPMATSIIAQRNANNGYTGVENLRLVCNIANDVDLSQFQFDYPAM